MAKLFVVLAILMGCGGTSAKLTPAAQARSAPTSFRVSVHGKGKPVIFIPGLACGGEVWDATVAHLGDNYESHVLSLAGFAGTPTIAAALLPTVHDELIHYIRDQHLVRPILVGHSLGGFMSFWIKIVAPVLVIAADGDGEIPRPAVEAAWHAQIDAIPHHELFVADHAKHFVFLDQPTAFQAALDRFLAKR